MARSGDYNFVVAGIPGLIEGAHEARSGTRFCHRAHGAHRTW
ncbi:MAG: hypothetical protein ACLTMP_07330 [Eggerthella lenta]